MSEEKPFLEHLEDLRWMIIKSIAVLTVALVGCFFYTKPILAFLMEPLRIALLPDGRPDKFLKVLGVVDPFTIQIQVSVFGGATLALPFILYFVGQFVLPALTAREKKFLLPVFATGALLFIAGLAFCYYLLMPQTLKFFLEYNDWLGFQSEWTIQNYLDFVIQMLIAFGISFELPLVLVILNLFGLVSNLALREHRKHAFIIILIFAACITPTTDVFSLAMLTVPMYFLYESTIWITWFIDRRTPKDPQAWEIGS